MKKSEQKMIVTKTLTSELYTSATEIRNTDTEVLTVEYGAVAIGKMFKLFRSRIKFI